MSYVQSHGDPAARASAVIVVGGIHALLGAGLVLGLTYTALIKPDVIVEVWDVPAAPKPDDPPPPPDTKDMPQTQTPTTAPVAPIDLYADNTNDADPVLDTGPIDPIIHLWPPLPTATIDPPLPTPSASFAPVSVRPRGRPETWITNDDYPSTDIRRRNEGTGSYRLVVGSDGRVDACQITATTGHPSLDRATCRMLERRARFEAAKDDTGRTVVGTYSGQVTWQIPE